MSDFAPDRLDEPPAAALPSEQFNVRMSAEGLPFRLLLFVGGQIALTGNSYHLRHYASKDMTDHETVLELHDLTEEMAVQAAGAFVSGWRFAKAKATAR